MVKIDAKLKGVIIVMLILSPLIYYVKSESLMSKSAYGKKVLAFYYTWYGNTTVYEEEPSWMADKWLHWNENNRNPPHTLAANDTPVLGAFDSADNNTIRQHITWAKDHGIDGFICTWWGPDNDIDYKFDKILRFCSDNNIDFELTIYFESAQPRYRNNGTEIAKDLKYVIDRYGNHSKFLKFQNRPVIFSYAVNYPGVSAFLEAKKILQQGGYNPFIVADIGYRKPTAAEFNIFDGFHNYNPVTLVVEQKDYLSAAKEMIYFSKGMEKLACFTVIPGYNDWNVCDCGASSGRNTYIIAERNDGALYREMWQNAMRSNTDWILICSFNEWHEGSEIEPSLQYGDFYLNLTQHYSNLWKTA